MQAHALQSHHSEPRRLRAAQLVRVSTAEQSAEGRAGIPRQYAETDRIIANSNYELVDTIEIIDVSGAAIHQAPEFKRLAQLAEAREIDVVVAAEMSRICRPDSMDKFAVLDALTRTGCLLNVGGQVVDLRSPEGFLTGGLHALFAGHERLAMKRKMQAAKEANRKRGYHTASETALPRGVSYCKKSRTWSYNDKVHSIVEAFRRVDEEGVRNLSELARLIGVTAGSVRRILSNEIYVGWRVYDEKRDPNAPRTRPDGRQADRPCIPRTEEEIIRVQVIQEPAVSRERFDRVQIALTETRMNHLKEIDKHRKINLCTGTARCGFCAEPFYATANGKRGKGSYKPPGYYLCKSLHPEHGKKLPRCSNLWVSRANLDDLMMAFCRDILFNHDVLFPLIAGAVKRATEVIRPFPVQSPESAIARLERKERRLVEMCGEGVIDIAELKRRKSEIRNEITQLKGIGAKQEKNPHDEIPMEEFIARLVNGLLRVTSPLQGDVIERKRVLQQIFKAVYFCEESITAFQFHESFVVNLVGDVDWLKTIITLETPFRIRERLITPPGHKRCRKCHSCHPKKDFYSNRATCMTCYLNAKKAYQRRKNRSSDEETAL